MLIMIAIKAKDCPHDQIILAPIVARVEGDTAILDAYEGERYCRNCSKKLPVGIEKDYKRSQISVGIPNEIIGDKKIKHFRIVSI